MRVSTKQLQQQGIQSILDQQSAVARLQNQIASGKRIQSPSDDPAAAVRILDIRQALDTNTQYQENIGAVRERLELEDTSLASAVDILQRVRELAIQGNNDIQSADSRRTLASEVRQRLDDLLSLANTRNSNGEYIFSGFQTDVRPFVAETDGTFTYNGDQGQRFLQVSAYRQLADGDSGSAVFREVVNGNGAFQVREHSANAGTGIIDPGSVVDPSALDGDSYRIQFADRTAVTGGAIGITDANNNDNLQYELRINGTLVYTGAEGSSRSLTQLAGDIQAQSGTTGVTAYVDGGVLYLANTSPGGGDITVNETLTGATEDTDTVTGYFGSVLTGLSNPGADITFDAGADSYLVLDSGNNIEASGAYGDGQSITFNGIETNVTGNPENGDQFSISPSTRQDIFTTVRNLALALESGADNPQTLTQMHNAINRVLLDLDRANDNLLETRSSIGARLNAADSQLNINEDVSLNLSKSLSSLEDLDIAEAASQLQQQLAGLQAAQAAYVRVQGLSLFEYL